MDENHPKKLYDNDKDTFKCLFFSDFDKEQTVLTGEKINFVPYYSDFSYKLEVELKP